MKRNLLIPLLSIAAFAVGCKASAEKPSAQIDVQAADDKLGVSEKNYAHGSGK